MLKICQSKLQQYVNWELSDLQAGFRKGRNAKYLTEAEEIKRWQEYTEELYKKGLYDRDNHDGVVTHLEPDILEWALGRIAMNKSSKCD